MKSTKCFSPLLTAEVRYLDELTRIGLLKKEKIGKHNYYINEPLFELFLKY